MTAQSRCSRSHRRQDLEVGFSHFGSFVKIHTTNQDFFFGRQKFLFFARCVSYFDLAASAIDAAGR